MKAVAIAGGLLLMAVLAIPLLFVSGGSASGDATNSGTRRRAGAIAGGNPLVPTALEPVFASAAAHSAVPEALLLAIGAEESGFDPHAGASTAGALGIMQMLPATFAEWAPRAGLSASADPGDPVAEIPAAAAMLAGNGAADGTPAGVVKALLAYNPAPGYVESVLRRMPDYAAWVAGPQPTGRPPVTGWPYGQCTYYVAQLRAERGAPVTWTGNAWEWLGNAAAQGVATTSMPRAGEIAVYQPGSGYDAGYGHVALVTQVTDTSYTVTEMNHQGLGVVDTRTVAWPDAHLEDFIP